MPSSPEQQMPAGNGPRAFTQGYKTWNRKLHFYLGLYFLFFIWLFALTGLLLNHSWAFTEFWPNRKVATVERQIKAPADGTALDEARDVMRQLGIAGEIQWLTTQPGDSGRLEFRATKPGLQFDIKADLKLGRATVQRTEVNAWGVMRALHTFTGVRMNDAKNQRDWMLTTIWALSMDAVALGLAVLVISGLIMWWGLAGKRALGLVALGCGILVCGWFVVGLRWIGV
ncbi:MAG: PepSY domain-containing protein [Opitutaceae bacterium]|nr:PepSY domain-containing protein [Opitutaceae bacterium]